MSMCHDLRQYVAAGLLLAGRMPGDESLGASVRRRFEQIHEQLTSISELITAEMQDAESKAERIDLSDLVNRCVRAAGLATHVDIQVEVSDHPVLYGDPVMLRRAVGNLLDNACRAAGDKGKVSARVGVREASAYVDVEDDGPGFGLIAPGMGHGIPLVRATVKAHRGRLEIGDATIGGTLVRVLLPLHQPSAATS